MNRPNLLYILADDLGWADLGMHGSPVETPVIDRLAMEGVELTQHYVCPMCTPTRASLLTGMHPGRFGAHATVPSNPPVLPDGYHTLATHLRDAGYDTGLFGKWHLGSAPQFGPNHFGFNTAYGSLAGGVDPYNHRYKRGEYSVTWHRNGELVEETGHVTDLIVREAVQWIETRKQPWFCYVPFTAVHIPIKPPQHWLAQYTPQRFDDNPLKNLSFQKYAAYTSQMDAGVGEILEAVERTCARESTIVIFASDNGAINDTPLHATDLYPGWQEAYPRLGSNAPFRGVKGQLYEGGIRTPTIVNWRGTLAPGTMDHPVHVTDWMPTLTRLVEAAPKEESDYDGVDIWPLIASQESSPSERRLFWNFRGGRDLGARCGAWKLISIERNDGIRKELFNIEEDPLEENECSAEYPDLVVELSHFIEAQRKADDRFKRDDSPQ